MWTRLIVDYVMSLYSCTTETIVVSVCNLWRLVDYSSKADEMSVDTPYTNYSWGWDQRQDRWFCLAIEQQMFLHPNKDTKAIHEQTQYFCDFKRITFVSVQTLEFRLGANNVID